MPDYGHDLLMGSFITPSAKDPAGTVELARHCERVGLDLVTFQDHPYQPRFLDTWTLMSYVAARTESIRLSANVVNLPLRHPAVLARSVASLDLLSGGRIELGIGAGGFWDAIEAMGGPRRSPGESVEALEEAIDIIRQIWDTESRGGVRLDGAHYRLTGGKRGPAPVHPPAIWVGAYGPRMLRLVGRLADGWLPSLGPLGGPEALEPMNRTIDTAATAAGRDPATVRRLLNVPGEFRADHVGLLQGPPEAWAADIAELAVTYGVSGFVLTSDDPAVLERYGREVAPAARELLARHRG